MIVLRKLPIILVSVLLLGTLGFPGTTRVVQAQPAATVVYNLYATDGYVEMADGTPVYTYGFVGGRQGVDFYYQQHFCTFDGITRTCATPVNVGPVVGGPPAPTGGPVTVSEAQFAGNAQFPAPIIYAAVGDVVEIRLKNLGVTANTVAPNDPHSIHLHGMDVDAANDGVPETSVGAVPANLCLDGSTAADCTAAGGPAPGAGNVIVYMFSPQAPGTYMYHCHQEADIHVNMGMYGALVVYNQRDPAVYFDPTNPVCGTDPLTTHCGKGPGQGVGGTLWNWRYNKDYILLLSEFDTRGHADEETTYGPGLLVPPNAWDPVPYNWAMYQPQYWFINGLSFPQTIHAAFPSGYTFADWLVAHPGYDPLISGKISGVNTFYPGQPGEKVLIRVINMGFETQPMHMHGYHGKIIGSDQRGWSWANMALNWRAVTRFGTGLEKNTLTIGSGETYEWLVDFGQQALNSVYPTTTETRYDPATNLPLPNTNTLMPPITEAGDPLAPPYIGGPTVSGIIGGADPLGLGSQYFPFHNHDDYKATNNGVYPGGMFTMLVPTP